MLITLLIIHVENRIDGKISTLSTPNVCYFLFWFFINMSFTILVLLVLIQFKCKWTMIHIKWTLLNIRTMKSEDCFTWNIRITKLIYFNIGTWRNIMINPLESLLFWQDIIMMIGSKGPCDALAQSHETLLDPPYTNGAVSVLVAHAHVVCVLRIISWGQNTFWPQHHYYYDKQKKADRIIQHQHKI